MLDQSTTTTLFHGDCLEKLKLLPTASVDMVLTDPPYGTTAAPWDSVIPFQPMWEQLRRVTKPSGAILLFCNQPFTSLLITSNLRDFKYCWYWRKPQHSNPFLAKIQPLRVVEDIAVFRQFHGTYNYTSTPILRVTKPSNGSVLFHGSAREHTQTQTGYPKNVLEFAKDRGLHPTQKPVALLSYLIGVYTDPKQTVLDFTMGSGSTGAACLATGRRFIGIEQDRHYYQVSCTRLGV